MKTARLSFALTTGFVFLVYLWSLAPGVTLDFSGIFSTGAMYLGVPHPPGYPLWTIYGWVVIDVFPFGNIAWRLAVATAFAGAMVSGVIAYIVAKEAANLFNCAQQPSGPGKEAIPLISGWVAGGMFAFSGSFWQKAVVVHPWSFSLLLLATSFGMLFAWAKNPIVSRFLIAALFLYGLSITNSQLLLILAPGWLCFVLFISPRVLLRPKIIGASFSFLLGASLYFLVPLFSMTNPPINWGYARTAEGFAHTLARGQYESVQPTADPSLYARQMGMYLKLLRQDLGILFPWFALIPVICLPHLSQDNRRFILGLFAMFVTSSFLLVYILNPGLDRQSHELHRSFFSVSYLVLSILAGLGVAILISRVIKSSP